ncbi:MAG: FtsQ-type POTRA domain-containing protein [Scytonema sp. PMC 1069.18]|nr:FtsQ-type POTRA domain-containing protein [Scytonema sp. PMC 1069.18]MEC4883182.1 FtsQ-type POTRA domain-containing protein [Scytonema sp. PMC 1070.18]
MAGIVSVSRAVLEGRRKRLRQKRQMKVVQTIWQSLAVSSLAGGLLWVTIQPIWVLKSPKEIVISGNHLLSPTAVQSLLGVSYPQSLWRIEPHRLAETLKQEPTIAQVTVSRRLFPPGLVVQLHERVPIAIAEIERENKNGSTNKVSLALVDANGVWIPLEEDILQNPQVKLPTLKILGSPEQYRSHWAELYHAIDQSSLKVREIDFRDPTNLILKTELGTVYLGAPTFQLTEQIKVLAQMRHLPSQLNSSQIEYIDLKNPESPVVQMYKKNQQMGSPSS